MNGQAKIERIRGLRLSIDLLEWTFWPLTQRYGDEHQWHDGTYGIARHFRFGPLTLVVEWNETREEEATRPKPTVIRGVGEPLDSGSIVDIYGKFGA